MERIMTAREFLKKLKVELSVNHFVGYEMLNGKFTRIKE